MPAPRTTTTVSASTPTGVVGGPAGLTGSKQSEMVPGVLYFRVRLVEAGTFTTGSGLDWSTQFDDSGEATSFFPVIGGEISVQGDGVDSTAIHVGDAVGGDLTGTLPNPTLAAIIVGGTIGDASHSVTVTFDTKGRATAGTSVAIQITEAQVTNLTADLALKSPLAGPTFTGVPAAPTAAPGTSTTQLATTAFVAAAVSANYPKVTDTQSLTGQGADIADTAFAGASTAGLYRVEVYLVETTPDLAAGGVTVHIKYTDAGGVRDQTAVPVILTGLGTLFAQAIFFVPLSSGSITFGVTHTGAFGSSLYALYATCERIA